jgi:hypothetical protein
MEEFEEDSFVVGNSVVEYETSFDELDLVDEFGSEDESMKKSRSINFIDFLDQQLAFIRLFHFLDIPIAFLPFKASM